MSELLEPSEAGGSAAPGLANPQGDPARQAWPSSPLLALDQPGLGLSGQLAMARRRAAEVLGACLRRPSLIHTGPARSGSGERLRIGYLGADPATVVENDLAEVLGQHDRRRFELFGYSLAPASGARALASLERLFDAFRELHAEDDEGAARRILDDGVDLLIDLKAYLMRPGILALRPAPVIINWLGYPGTLGVSRLADYVIGDPLVTPLADAAHYSEKLALMPDCFLPVVGARQQPRAGSRAEAGLPEAALVLAAFSDRGRLSAATLDLWCRVLAAIPGGVLWLRRPSPDALQRLRAEFEHRGIAAGRLHFAPALSRAEHRSRLRLADLALDTYPCTSPRACADALAAGVPFLSLKAETFAGRMSSSLLAASGVPELSVASADQFAAQASLLARDEAQRAALRESLLNARTNSPLFDTGKFTRDLERLYLRIWKSHLGCRHEHVVPWPVEKALAARERRRPAGMKIAVVTPYYKEPEAELRQCHESVLAQTVDCTHFMVADGFPQAALDGWDVRHVKLPVAHGDAGDCARGVGAMAAIGEGFDAIAFLDADNWYEPQHLETMLSLYEETLADVCIARRKLHRVDGSLLYEDNSSDGEKFVDTNCYFITRPAFGVLSLWVTMPHDLWGVGDRVFFAALKRRGYSRALASEPTVAYRTRWSIHYTKVGETPPDGGKERNEIVRRSLQAFDALTPVQRAAIFR